MLLKDFLSVLTEREDITSILLSDYSTGEKPKKYSLPSEPTEAVLAKFYDRTVFDIHIEALGYANVILYISVR
jgi:hypothetical protein